MHLYPNVTKALRPLNMSETWLEPSGFIILLVMWAEMAFVLAQAVGRNPLDAWPNGLRLLHLPLEQSEDPPPTHPPKTTTTTTTKELLQSLPACLIIVRIPKALRSHTRLQQTSTDHHKKSCFPAESSNNEQSFILSHNERFSNPAARHRSACVRTLPLKTWFMLMPRTCCGHFVLLDASCFWCFWWFQVRFLSN